MYKPFFGTQFKITVLLMAMVVLFTWPIVGSQAQLDELENRELKLDLLEGGAELFKEINKGVIQIINLSGSAGSGYIIDKEGHAITNRHVTSGGQYMEVAFWGEQEKSRVLGYRHRGVLLAEDPALDMALIKVEAPYEKFFPIKLAESGLMEAGDVVATCGSPGGVAQAGNYLNPSDPLEGWLEYFNINVGVLTEIVPFEQIFAFGFANYDPAWSSSRREHYATAVEYMFHVDSAINHGNSGGPCFNAYAEAIGTNTWGLGWLENWGFSVPTDLLKKSAADILAYGEVRRPWVGIALHSEIDSSTEAFYYAGKTEGLWFEPRPKDLEILVVNPYSPAYEAGLREGDIINRIDGQKMDYIFDIYKYFLNANLGQEIEFKIRRGKGKPMSFVVTVEKKQIRYFGADITGMGRSAVQTLHSPITY